MPFRAVADHDLQIPDNPVIEHRLVGGDRHQDFDLGPTTARSDKKKILALLGCRIERPAISLHKWRAVGIPGGRVSGTIYLVGWMF